MSTFESSVKIVEYPQEKVYATLSDLSNLGKLEGKFPEDKFKDFEFSADSVSISVQPVGKVAMNIVDREEPKCIKYETTQSPVPFNLWVQLLPVTETTCKMKLTIKADLNPFIKGMISGPLNEGLEKLAETLGISQPNATYKVNNLAAKGYVMRLPSSGDKRETRVCVSDRFYKYYGDLDHFADRAVEALQAEYTPEELELMERMLRSLSKHVE